MHSGRKLPRSLFLAPSAAALVLVAAGCSSSDAQTSITVPTPSSEAAAYCEALHEELPETVAGMDRSDPEPDSDLTAGWGDGAIVLRCGVPRPSKMGDVQSEGIEADGVNWLLEQREGAGPRFTTAYRKAYVEVTLPREFAHDITPLAEFAASVRKTVPERL
ncbi:DUF3515 family protein [Streptomyces finlayi]|uniref:DUF3515 family protein n=1 Tax=Streptomyces finlayi TaxID=67296 RepID=A0A7G7BUX8_9ACTN|nr:DUF3515 domain-containing protein [Streptomyces finlayi]QNE79143.1 DUF3515 family protein [Streptomyces finlayi]